MFSPDNPVRRGNIGRGARGASRGRGRRLGLRGRGGGGPRDVGFTYLQDQLARKNVGETQLLTNCHQIHVSDQPLWVYAPSFPATVTDDLFRRRMVTEMWETAFGSKHQIPFGEIVFVSNLIYTLKPIEQFHDTSYDVRHHNSRFNMEVTFIRQITNRTPTSIDESQLNEQLHSYLLQLALRKSDLVHFHSNYYDREPRTHELSDEFDILPAWVPRLLWRSSGWILEVHTYNKVLCKINMLDSLKQRKAHFQGPEEQIHNQLHEEVKWGVYWLSHSHKFVTLGGIDWTKTPSSTFDNNGTTTSFASYFQQVYNVHLEPNQPLAYRWIGYREEYAYYPIQILKKSGNFSEPLLEIINQLTQTKPGETVQRIREFFEVMTKQVSQNNRAPTSPMDFLKNWGIQLPSNAEQSSIVVDTIALKPFTIDIGSERFPSSDGFFAPKLRNIQIPNPQPINNWVYVYHDATEAFALKMLDFIKSRMEQLKINAGDPLVILVPGRNRFDQPLDNALEGKAPPQFVFACAIDQDKTTYDLFKNYCTTRGIVSQYFAESEVKSKPQAVIGSNLVLQAQAKLGATLWNVELPPKVFGPNGSFPTLILGMEVYYGKHTASCLALVGMFVFHNKLSWFSKTKELPPTQEVSQLVTPLVAECLQHFNSINAPEPRTVIIYRDGVDEYQFNLVRSLELEPVKQTIKATHHEACIVFNIVQKGVNTKFFSPNTRDLNLSAGTVISSTVTRDQSLFGHDYFIQSGMTEVGTSSPVHINVLYNDLPPEAGVQPSDLYDVTYSLSHMYYNQGFAIDVPCVCRYSRRLAVFMCEHTISTAETPLMPVPSLLLDKLYYI
ncbi:hypothetical protein GEMRC1_003422 [Eukaryota sp. GEM-RC1]